MRRVSVTLSRVSGATGARARQRLFVRGRPSKLLTLTFKTRETGFPLGSALGTGPGEELLNLFICARVLVPVSFPFQIYNLPHVPSDKDPSASISFTGPPPPSRFFSCSFTSSGLCGVASEGWVPVEISEVYIQQSCLKQQANDVPTICSRCSDVLGKRKPGLRTLPLEEFSGCVQSPPPPPPPHTGWFST